jgi:quercetin dioxygenase-like cupin family protein
MEIKRAGSPASGKGRAEWFTGTVRADPLFSAPEPARVAGALVTFEPGGKHWHGAGARTAMSHIAIQEKLNGSPVDWLEHVTDEEYAGEG